MTSNVVAPAGERALVVVGAGGHGREILDMLEAAGGRDRFVGFVDESVPAPLAEQRLRDRSTSVVGDLAWLLAAGHDFVIGIGSSAARRRIAAALDAAPGSAVSVCHPAASVGSLVTLSPGVVVGAHTTITTNVVIGRHSHVNVGCAVQHDSVLGEFVTVSPGVFINGDVRVGDDVFIGTGAVITRGCSVGAGATIGAGAVVLADVAPGTRVFGLPAR